MKKKLYVDIDGVVGDLVAAIFSFFPEANLRDPSSYHLEKMFSNVDTNIINYPSLYSATNFKLYPFVGEVLQEFEILDYEIVFVSARPHKVFYTTVSVLKQLKLRSDFRIYLGLYPIEQKITKIRDDIILNQVDKAWVIEDNPNFIMAMAGKYMQYPELRDKLKTLMYMQPYNQSENNICHISPEFTPVMNWKHILREVTYHG